MANYPLIAYHPFKALFQLTYIASIIARLPYRLAACLIPSLRPHPTWSFKPTLIVGITETLPAPPPLQLQENNPDARFQAVEPSSRAFYKGPLESNKRVQPATTGEEGVVVLYLHGGAFVQGDSGESFCGFPAALQDTLTAYLHLLHSLRIPASQIEFGGVIDVPRPRCVLLFSPWVAPFNYKDIRSHANFPSDLVPVSFLRWGALTYGQGLEKELTHPYVTLLGNPFKTSVPVFVNYGMKEVFCDDIARWAEEMKGAGGNVLEVHKEENACHDTFLLGGITAFEESAGQVAALARRFVERVG
ncbi:alpha/beta hydrolase fold-3 domain-containing protein [Xylariaceae sp. FL0594]|nr:alpha/beta hydrolase fold-3 domain-containing protein [Xylariaceae sp. FL0594]